MAQKANVALQARTQEQARRLQELVVSKVTKAVVD